MALFNFEGSNLIEVGFLTRDCEFPILNLQRTAQDQFLRNVPIFFGRWKDGITQRAITSVQPTITISEGLTKCQFATIRTDSNGCRWVVPNMASIRFETYESISWDEAIEGFCDARSYVNGATLLTSDGMINEGNQLSGDFAQFMYAGLKHGTLVHLEDVLMDGVQGNDMEFDGFLTQLQNGWTAADTYSSSCDMFNSAVQLSWGNLTGNGEGTSAGPEETITAANDSITLWGQTFAGFTGLNYAEFTLRLKEIIEETFARPYGGVDQWEWVVPYGQKRCLRESLACIQPCDGAGAAVDEMMRERYADYYSRDIVEIYPDDDPIMLQESHGLDDTIIFGPRMIGGDPTYGLTFRNMMAVVPQLRAALGQGHDYTNGIEGWNHPLVQNSLGNLRDNFETLAFLTKLNYDDKGRCFTPTVETWPGMLVFARHMFVVMSDIHCQPQGAVDYDVSDPMGPQTYVVSASADDATGTYTTELDLTLATAINTSHEPDVADDVVLLGADGVYYPFKVLAYAAGGPTLTVGSDDVVSDAATLDPSHVIV